MQLANRPVASKASAAGSASARTAPVVHRARRDLLLTAGVPLMTALLGSSGAAHAAGESSATRAITAVTRPQQLKKKDENRQALKEQVEKIRAGEADPKSLP